VSNENKWKPGYPEWGGHARPKSNGNALGKWTTGGGETHYGKTWGFAYWELLGWGGGGVSTVGTCGVRKKRPLDVKGAAGQSGCRKIDGGGGEEKKNGVQKADISVMGGQGGGKASKKRRT